ncbi:glycosyltransferase family 39 protein [Streptomyces sp. NPDC003032]
MIGAPEQGCPSIPGPLNSAFPAPTQWAPEQSAIRSAAHARGATIATESDQYVESASSNPLGGSTPPAPSRSRPRSTVAPGLLLTLALGFWGLRRQGSMWRDEVVTYDVAHRAPTDLWQTLGNADAVHGLYYLLMHGLFRLSQLFRLFHDADPLLVLRVPSVLAMGAATVGVALLGRRLAGPRAGLLAGVVFAVLPSVQRQAQEGRSYAMVCALVVWATYLLVVAVQAPRGRRGRRTRRLWCGYGALMLLACLLHEFAVFALPAHAVTVPGAARRAWAAAAGGVVVGVAPLVALSQRQQAQVDWLHFDAGAYAGAAGLCALGVCCAVLHRMSAPGEEGRWPALVRPALALLVVPVSLLMLLAPLKPLFTERYVMYGMAGVALLVGALLDRALSGGRGLVAVAVVTAGAALAALFPVALNLRTPAGRLDDSIAAAHAIRAVGGEGDAVVYMPLRRRVWSLAAPGAVRELRDIALDRSPVASDTLYGTEVPADVIRGRMRAEPRIVLVTDPSGRTDDRIERETVKWDVITSRFEKCRSWSGQGARVTLYARPGRC